MDNIATYTQYGNILIPSKQIGVLRGSGNFNPPPLWEQSTDRGKAGQDTLKKSNFVGTSNLQPIGFDDAQDYTDNIRKRAYVIGDTGFHPELESWERPEFQGVENKYVQWALKALVPGGMTATPMIVYLFSTDNINYLQERIKSEVKKHTGKDVNNQSIDELLIIMRSTILYAYSGWLPGGNKDNLGKRGEQYISLEERLSRINKSIIEEGVKQVLSGILQYEQYIKDISSLPMPLSLPVYTSMSGSRELSESIGFNSGLERTIAAQSFNQRYNII